MSSFAVIVVIIASFIAVAGIGWVVSIFNSLIQVRNNVSKAWYNIDVLLLQRNEELPKLIDICKAYAAYERDLLQSLSTLRSAYQNAKSIIAKTNIENRLRDALGTLSLAAERYPDLKTNELYRKAMERVTDLESMIADRRVFFNETVNIYNTRIELVPQAFFAIILRYKPYPLLKLTSGGRP